MILHSSFSKFFLYFLIVISFFSLHLNGTQMVKLCADLPFKKLLTESFTTVSVIVTVNLHCQGNVGILDVSTRNYTTVMRSHVGRILSSSVDPQRRHIATVSDDHTIRLWDFDTLQQVCAMAANFRC